MDLACGYGRHSISLAKRGFSVVGVDITKDYIDDAIKTAKENNLDAKFINADIRELVFKDEFDVVLNLADGAIGYLENDEENLKIFDVISNALKVGGKHFMDVCNADYADIYFPRSNWECGEQGLALSTFDWDKEKRRMLFGGYDILFGTVLSKPEIPEGNPTRLYSLDELSDILNMRNMKIKKSFSDYYGTPSSSKYLQLIVYSEKI